MDDPGVKEKVSVTVSAPREYDVDCPYLPGYKPPLVNCQAALDLLPWGDEALRFGPAESAGVDVSLPRSYKTRGCLLAYTNSLLRKLI